MKCSKVIGIRIYYIDRIFLGSMMGKNKSGIKNIRKKMEYYTKHRKETMEVKPAFTREDAMMIARALKIDFGKEKFDLDEFTAGINVELEHGSKFLETNVTKNDPILTGKIAFAHLKEFPDYYTRLKKLEDEAVTYWSQQK